MLKALVCPEDESIHIGVKSLQGPLKDEITNIHIIQKSHNDNNRSMNS